MIETHPAPEASKEEFEEETKLDAGVEEAAELGMEFEELEV